MISTPLVRSGSISRYVWVCSIQKLAVLNQVKKQVDEPLSATIWYYITWLYWPLIYGDLFAILNQYWPRFVHHHELFGSVRFWIAKPIAWSIGIAVGSHLWRAPFEVSHHGPCSTMSHCDHFLKIIISCGRTGSAKLWCLMDIIDIISKQQFAKWHWLHTIFPSYLWFGARTAGFAHQFPLLPGSQVPWCDQSRW